MPNRQRRVVITGMGALTPLGLSVEAFWQAMMRGDSGAAPITYFDTADFPTHFACELKGFDPLAYFDRKAARRLDRFAQYAQVVADQAVEDAGLDSETMSDEEKERVAVIFGSGIGGFTSFYEQTRNLIENGVRRLTPFFIPLILADIASGHISIRHGFTGPNYSVVSACR